MENKTIKVIKNRVSCRSYSEKVVPLSKVKMVAECGKMAPTARNRQIPFISVVRSKKYVDRLKALSLEVFQRDCFYGAKTMLIVHAPREDKFCIQDSTCVLENMFIAASSLNIASCWINQVDDMFATEKGKKLKKSLKIPEENMVVGTCILGYPNDGVKLEVKPRKEDFITYL